MKHQANRLSLQQLRRRCNPDEFDFQSTQSLPALEDVIGQDRAFRSVSFGIDIKSKGYHMYALGPVGTGKTTNIRKFLERDAVDKPVPYDWLYVNNFDDHDKPHALSLPAGKGREFKDDMDRLVEELETEVPQAFEAKEYRQEKEQIEGKFEQQKKELFEQLYEEIEGDSAASAELYALLSSLSGYPLRQDLAVTGSVNQHGEIQAIGGVNEKIEGFFQVCKLKGLTGNQGVIIPRENVKHLMLREDVIDAARNGKFHVHAVSTIDEGMELLTGKEAGERKSDGTYLEDTVNAAVQGRIRELAMKAKQFSRREDS